MRRKTALADPALWWAIKGLSLILINANSNPRVAVNENTARAPRSTVTNIFQGDCVKSHLPWHCFFIPQISGINVICSDVAVIKMISGERDEREIENMGEREREVWLCVASYGLGLVVYFTQLCECGFRILCVSRKMNFSIVGKLTWCSLWSCVWMLKFYNLGLCQLREDLFRFIILQILLTLWKL